MKRALLVVIILGLLGLTVGCSDDTVPAADQGTGADQALDLTGADLVSTSDTSPLPDTGSGDQGSGDQGSPVDAAPTADKGSGKDFGITCSATLGSAQVTGSVKGKAVKASHAGAVKASLAGLVGYGVALLDKGGTCTALASVATAPKLWILLCNSAPGTYAIGKNCLGDAGGLSLPNQASIPTSGTDPKATGGTVTITSFDPSCGGTVKGSFSLNFSGETVTGSFDTVGCGTISL
jgi:hypothetical protein